MLKLIIRLDRIHSKMRQHKIKLTSHGIISKDPWEILILIIARYKTQFQDSKMWAYNSKYIRITISNYRYKDNTHKEYHPKYKLEQPPTSRTSYPISSSIHPFKHLDRIEEIHPIRTS